MKRLGIILAALLMPLVLMSAPASAAAGSVSSIAVEDTFVTKSAPTTSRGSAASLRISGDPEKFALLKFNVSVPEGATVTSAVLTLTGTGTQPSQSVDIHTVGNTWNEATTYSTRPTVGEKVASGTISAGTKTNFTVPVNGNGTISFAVRRVVGGSDNLVASSENGTLGNRPKLVVNYVTEDVPPPPPPPTGNASLPYGADSYFQSRVDGPDVQVNQTRTTEFRNFMATHPEQAGITWPKLNMNVNWAMSYDYGTADDPIWKLTGGNTSDPRLRILQTQGFHMSDAVASSFPTGTQDRPGVVIDRVFGYTVQFADAVPNMSTRTISVSNAGIMWHSSNGLDYRNPLSNDSRNFTSRGRILDAMIVTREELDAAVAANTGVGHVLHLFFVETRSTDGFNQPMVGAEGGKYGWGAEGERLRIKPTVDLEARGLTGYALALARTLQQNGAYIGDNSGSATQIKLSQPDRYTGTGLTTDVFKGKLTWADFEVVTEG